MTAPDTDNTELWREALGIMGYEVYEKDPHGLFIYDSDESLEPITLDDEWNLFGIAWSWLVSRGCTAFEWEQIQGEFLLLNKDSEKWLESSEGPTLPLAAARWVCEHGHKIAEEATK